MIPEDVVALGIAKLTERYRVGPEEALPNIDVFMRIMLGRWRAVEDALAWLLDHLSLEDAVGWILDEIYGRLFALRRQAGWTDDTYREFLRTKSLALRSSGKPDQLIVIAHRLAYPGTPIGEVLLTRYHMSNLLTFPFQGNQTLAGHILRSADMAGVGMLLETYDPDLTGGWGSSTGDDVDDPGVFGSSTGGDYGPALFSHLELL